MLLSSDKAWLHLLVLASACGRIGFSQSSVDDDAAIQCCDANNVELVDRGVLVRYPLSDDFEGKTVRSSTEAYDLALLDADNTTVDVSEFGKGLRFAMVGADDRACAETAGSPLASLEGSTTGTIEVVADIVDGHDNRSRLAAIGTGGQWGFAVGFSAIDSRIICSMNNTVTEFGRWQFDAINQGRAVYTIVFDSTVADADERVRLFVDGLEVPTLGGEPIALGTALELGDSSFCIGNRASGARSLEGAVYYVALYSTALTAAEVSDNSAKLLAGDD